MPEQEKVEQKDRAVTSLIAGIIAILFAITTSLTSLLIALLFSVIAIVLGAIAIKNTRRKKVANTGIALGVTAFVVALLMMAIPALYSGIAVNKLEDTLQLQASHTRSELPKKVNEFVTVTSIDVQGTTITYNALLTNNVDESKINESFLKDQLIGLLCRSADSRSLLDQGATFQYIYTHSKSGQIYNIKITKTDCVD